MHSHIFTETDRNNEEVAILYMERSTYMYYMLPKSRSCQHKICLVHVDWLAIPYLMIQSS